MLKIQGRRMKNRDELMMAQHESWIIEFQFGMDIGIGLFSLLISLSGGIFKGEQK